MMKDRGTNAVTLLLHRERPTTVYHYTTLAGAYGILEGNSIHATQVGYTNDRTEFKYGLDLTRGRFVERAAEMWPGKGAEQLAKLLPTDEHIYQAPYFTFSLAQVHDRLSFWRSYGDATGTYALGFDTEELCTRIPYAELVPCVYEPVAHRKMVDELWPFVQEVVEMNLDEDGIIRDHHAYDLRQTLMPMFALLASALKHPDFAEEHEWRLVFDRHTPYAYRTKLRGTSEIPHIVVPSEDLLPVTSVRIGPTAPDPARLRDQLRALLRRIKLDPGIVTVSESPLRHQW